MAQQAVTFHEIEKMLAHFPPASASSCIGCTREKPDLEKITTHLTQWQVNDEGRLKLSRPRVCLFAGSHGFQANSVEKTMMRVSQSAQGEAGINKLCQLADAELRVYELDIENPTQDITVEAAMDEEAAARAITYGMMAIEPGLDLVVLGSIGAGASLASQAIQAALLQEEPSHKVISKAFKVQNIQSIQKPLDILRCLGGYDLCAMVGAAIASRMAGIPILIDSHSGQAIRCLLNKMSPDAGEHLYHIDQDAFPSPVHQAVAIIPSLKAFQILNPTQSCASKSVCTTRKAS